MMTQALRVNDNVDLVLALTLAHLWMHLWVDRAARAGHYPGMAQQIRLQYPGAILSSDGSRRRPGGRSIR